MSPAQVADCLRGDASPFIGADDYLGEGVPCFRFNQRQVVSGAQPAEVLLGYMREALRQAALA
ncbi:hypothetical protein D3C75_1337440 [compost metagenome]